MLRITQIIMRIRICSKLKFLSNVQQLLQIGFVTQSVSQVRAGPVPVQ